MTMKEAGASHANEKHEAASPMRVPVQFSTARFESRPWSHVHTSPSAGVTGVVNVQTEKDINQRMVNMDLMRQCAPRPDMSHSGHNIQDTKQKILLRVLDAALKASHTPPRGRCGSPEMAAQCSARASLLECKATYFLLPYHTVDAGTTESTASSSATFRSKISTAPTSRSASSPRHTRCAGPLPPTSRVLDASLNSLPSLQVDELVRNAEAAGKAPKVSAHHQGPLGTREAFHQESPHRTRVSGP